MRKWLLRIAVVLFFIVIGFLQEWVKVNVNWFIDHLPYVPNYDSLSAEDRLAALSVLNYDAPYDYYYSHTTIESLANLTTGRLVLLKHAIALGLAALYFGLNMLVFKRILRKPELNKILVYIYIGISFIVAAFFGYYFLVEQYSAVYNVGRELLGFLQSPLPLVVVFLSSKLFSLNPVTKE